MFNLKKEGVISLLFAGLILGSFAGCGGGSDGGGQSANNPPVNYPSVDSTPVVGGGDSDQSTIPKNFQTLYEDNSKIEVYSLQVTSDQTSENIPEQDRIEVYRVQDSSEGALSFKFEWDISSIAVVSGKDALVFRKGDEEVRIASVFANGRSSMLMHQAECKIQMDWSAACVVSGKADSVGSTVTSDLATLLGGSPGEVIVESKFCNVLGSCNRYRLGTIFIH